MLCRWSLLVVMCTGLFLLLGAAALAAEPRYHRARPGPKQPRAIRGFKGMPLQVGRGFGKRADMNLDMDVDIGPADIDADSNERLATDAALATMPVESFPLDWIAGKMRSSPHMAKTVLRKFVDTNGDDQLSLDELLRPVPVY